VTVAGEENVRGDVVLYLMRSARRLLGNLALEYAIAKANAMKLPVVVCETAESGSERQRAFLLDGVYVNERDAASRGIRYTYSAGGQEALSRRARILVTDEHPLLEDLAAHRVDGNGILPMRALSKEQYSARFLRDRAHRLFPELWARIPEENPARSSQQPARRSGGPASPRAERSELRATGGHDEALSRLETFIADGLIGYAEARNRSTKHLSGLSPYLRFGHIGIHEIAERVLASDAPDKDVDAFLEQAIIRRELSFNLCFYNRNYASLAALPDWARKTLGQHRGDRRKPSYSYEELENAATHDEVWNLAQRQLLMRGTIHGYLRMLWGKKIIEWSDTPEEAFEAMVRLHDEYALDGRDPNTYAGILWCFGKHDRPWAPERPIFGSIRWMSSEQTAKKVRLRELESELAQV
jgi:deoxyribodipyrimidine photo-lyase